MIQKIVILFLLFFALCFNVEAQRTSTSTAPVIVTEEDGDPAARARTIKFSNGSVTDNDDGTVSVSNDINAITNCATTDNFCFQYVDSVLKLYVNSTLQAQWPIVAVFDKLSLESDISDNLLLEIDDGSVILLE